MPRTGKLYLATLLILVAGFYGLLIGSLALSAFLLVKLVQVTPSFVAHQGSYGSIKGLLLAYLVLLVYMYAVARALLVTTTNTPGGLKLTRVRHPEVFALIQEVATRLDAKPIDQIYLVPGDEIGVWEETALFRPPGTGKQYIELGMAALAYLTRDELCSILAHEYAHFSHHDTFFARFIYRVSRSYTVLLNDLREHGGWTRYINPLYWILYVFTAGYPRLAARFSRLQEHHADREAVLCYGRELFARALITSHLEGAFFAQAAPNGAMNAAARGTSLPNVYHFVAVTRREYERTTPGTADAALAALLTARSHRFDAHPPLGERLDRQDVPAASRHPYALPRPVRIAALDTLIDVPDREEISTGERSAAEELFGTQVAALQGELSDAFCAFFVFLARAIKEHAEKTASTGSGGEQGNDVANTDTAAKAG